MIEYHVVLEGINGFQKEEDTVFINNTPPAYYFTREYQTISHRFSFDPEGLTIKVRKFSLQKNFYALGKNIVYYSEERS